MKRSEATNPRKPLTSQVLWHRVIVDVSDGAAATQLARMHQRADHAVAPIATVHIKVTGDGSAGYQVFDGQDLLAEVTSPREVLDEVFARVHRRAFELASLKGWVRFHGAVLRIGNQRLALVGASGSGKTTLALRLLTNGHAIETDESFVARGADVFSVARRLHVKPGTTERFPDTSWASAAPILDGAQPLRTVDPTEHGFGWPITSGPIDHIIVVEPNDGPSALTPVGPSELIQGLIEESFPVTEPRAAVVRQAAALVTGRGTYRLLNGGDGQAAELVARLVAPQIGSAEEM